MKNFTTFGLSAIVVLSFMGCVQSIVNSTADTFAPSRIELRNAARNNNINEVRHYLNESINVDAANDYGCTALVLTGSGEIARLAYR